MARNYKDYGYGIQGAAATIISECVWNGKSTNWCGSEEDLAAVQEICSKYNVEYVDDFYGEWKNTK